MKKTSLSLQSITILYSPFIPASGADNQKGPLKSVHNKKGTESRRPIPFLVRRQFHELSRSKPLSVTALDWP